MHDHDGFVFDNAHGGWEYPTIWIAAPIAQALLRDGAYAVLSTILFHGGPSHLARA